MLRCSNGTASADRNHAGEAGFVGAVINAARDAFHTGNLAHQNRQQRQGQKTVSNRAHAQFFLRALGIEVNPLMVAGRIGKHIDPLLVDFIPIADAQFFADSTGIFVKIFKNAHCYLLQFALIVQTILESLLPQ